MKQRIITALNSLANQGFSSDYIARCLGLDAEELHALFQGEYEPDYGIAASLYHHFDVDIAWLINGKEG